MGAVAIIVSLLFLSGCNLMGIKPVSKQPIPPTEEASKTAPQSTDIENERKKLSERMAQIETQLQQNQLAYETKLQDMDRTIALLEQNIELLKISIQNAEQKRVDKKAKPKEKKSFEPDPTPKRAKNASTASIPKKQSNLNGEMRTPETSKAVETVSLLKSGLETKKSPVKKGTSKKTKIQIVGIDTENENSTTTARQYWEDPDLKEPSTPIQLKVVPGAKRRYQQAFKIYSSRNYTESIKYFSRFLVDFPNDQDSDNSQFWIGQSHFQLGNYLQAEQAFRKILKNYKHGATRSGYKTPDATLMLGRIYLTRKKPIKARYYFSQVVQQYPDSRSAVKAKKEIQAMNSF